MWEKYWVFQGLQSLGKYDKETSKFSKRDKTTVYPFPSVEREYIFTTLKLMEDFLKDKKSEEDIKQALSTGNFKLLYEYVIKQSLFREEQQSNSTDGKWIKYEQGSDYNILRNSLQGYYTGWCTAAGENFAKDQLEDGDFYVYYTLDENGDAKVPRIAIRMDGKNKIGEIRGISGKQNMEPEMMSILEEKLKEFPDRDKYLKKENDMKLLTLIDKKVNDNIDLTLEELKFLYEIDGQIIGFGYGKDPRIEEIKRKRNERRDYSLIFNVKEEEVALSQKEWLNNPKKFKALPGNIDLGSLTSADGLVLPQHVGGNIFLRHLTSADGLVLPQHVGGNIYLSSLASADGLVLPQHVGGDIDLRSLASADGLVLPESIGGRIDLSSLTSADGLILPKQLGGSIDLRSLTSADGLVLPQHVGGYIDLRSLTSADGLILPQHIGGYINLSSLTSADGLVLPESIGGDIYLNSLTSADGLILPQHVDGNIDLSSLTSADRLVLPHDFNLFMLYCPYYIGKEIMNNPDKYYMAPTEEDKKEIKK